MAFQHCYYLARPLMIIANEHIVGPNYSMHNQLIILNNQKILHRTLPLLPQPYSLDWLTIPRKPIQIQTPIPIIRQCFQKLFDIVLTIMEHRKEQLRTFQSRQLSINSFRNLNKILFDLIRSLIPMRQRSQKLTEIVVLDLTRRVDKSQNLLSLIDLFAVCEF